MRLVGFGFVFMAVLFTPFFLSVTQVGMIPNCPGFDQLFLVAGATSLFLAGGLAWLIEGHQARAR
jgi:hypothetical protein